MKQGVSFSDTLAGLSDVLCSLLKENIFPVIIGGSSALVTSIDRAFTVLKTRYTMVSVDPRIDYSNTENSPDSFNYLNKIIGSHKSTFSQYINIGYQTYLNDQQVMNRFIRRHSELIRIGDVRQAIYLTEPLFRDSDAAIFDISAVRQSDAPGTAIPSPNGFYGEEICLLSRYAGISDNLKIFGLFDVNPELDIKVPDNRSGCPDNLVFSGRLFTEAVREPRIEQQQRGTIYKISCKGHRSGGGSDLC